MTITDPGITATAQRLWAVRRQARSLAARLPTARRAPTPTPTARSGSSRMILHRARILDMMDIATPARSAARQMAKGREFPIRGLMRTPSRGRIERSFPQVVGRFCGSILAGSGVAGDRRLDRGSRVHPALLQLGRCRASCWKTGFMTAAPPARVPFWRRRVLDDRCRRHRFLHHHRGPVVGGGPDGPEAASQLHPRSRQPVDARDIPRNFLLHPDRAAEHSDRRRGRD